MNRYIVEEADLAYNLQKIKESTSLEIIGVVKGNGYGMGLEYLARFLTEHGVRMVAVTELADAQRLRDQYMDQPILLLRSTPLPEEAEKILRLDCTATIGSLKSAWVLNEVAASHQIRVKAHIKIDTGLTRFGFVSSEVSEAARELKKLEWIDFEGIYTHFSNAYAKDGLTRRQYEMFRQAVAEFEKEGFSFSMVHCANTPAFFNEGSHIEEGMTAVRIGSGWTGRVITWQPHGLKKVGVIASDVLEVREISKGTKVGYSGVFTASKPMKVAIIPIGHYDGFGIEGKDDMTDLKTLVETMISKLRRYLRHERMSVEIGGHTYPVVGYVGLTSIAVDVTSSDVKPGDTAYADVSPLFVNPIMQREYRR